MKKAIKRAGMDYWKDLDVTTYINYEDFLKKNPGAKIYMATTKGPQTYVDVHYEEDCYIMFGKESGGIPGRNFAGKPGDSNSYSDDWGYSFAEFK